VWGDTKFSLSIRGEYIMEDTIFSLIKGKFSVVGTQFFSLIIGEKI